MLPTTTTNPNMPNWARFTVESNQVRMDLQYLQGSGNSVEHWKAVCASWKAEQTRLREAFPGNKADYKPVFSYPIPEREVSDWDDTNPFADSMGFVIRRQTYPEITPIPTLDPYVAPPVNPGFPSGGAQQQQDTILNLLGMILAEVKKLTALVLAKDGKAGV